MPTIATAAYEWFLSGQERIMRAAVRKVGAGIAHAFN